MGAVPSNRLVAIEHTLHQHACHSYHPNPSERWAFVCGVTDAHDDCGAFRADSAIRMGQFAVRMLVLGGSTRSVACSISAPTEH